MPASVAVVPGDTAAPLFKIFGSGLGQHVLVAPHSRIFDLPDQGGLDPSLLAALADTAPGEVPLDAVIVPSPQSISLNVSSTCNLSCSYCYASRGSFAGAQQDPMSLEVACSAIDSLLHSADRSAPVTVGFLGGEPFVNRQLIHRAVHYAAAEGRRLRLDVRFSVTTNGTLLEDQDVELLQQNPFAVTVSIDGGELVQNRQRPTLGGQGSYQLLCAGTRSLLSNPHATLVAARATVTRSDFNLRERLEAMLALGFREAGFAPLRTSKGGDALGDEDWPRYLNAMIEVAQPELERAYRGESIRLTNLAVALKQLYRGASSPYPCGAGGGYFSVAANGDWYACHRAIGAPAYRMGNNAGLEPGRRIEFLTERHVHSQSACSQCWARYLCSGGCHQEASSRTDSSCGFIRGWLEFCLSAYCDLTQRRPDFFASAATQSKERTHE